MSIRVTGKTQCLGRSKASKSMCGYLSYINVIYLKKEELTVLGIYLVRLILFLMTDVMCHFVEFA